MINIREEMSKKPWLGWAVAGVLLVVAIVIYVRRTGNSDPYSPERMTEMVTIKFTDTGDEMEIPRGRLDKELRGRSDLSPGAGVINPKTGAATGFPFNKKDWESWIARIQKEKADAKAAAPAKAAANNAGPDRTKVVRPEVARELLTPPPTPTPPTPPR